MSWGDKDALIKLTVVWLNTSLIYQLKWRRSITFLNKEKGKALSSPLCFETLGYIYIHIWHEASGSVKKNCRDSGKPSVCAHSCLPCNVQWERVTGQYFSTIRCNVHSGCFFTSTKEYKVLYRAIVYFHRGNYVSWSWWPEFVLTHYGFHFVTVLSSICLVSSISGCVFLPKFNYTRSDFSIRLVFN